MPNGHSPADDEEKNFIVLCFDFYIHAGKVSLVIPTISKHLQNDEGLLTAQCGVVPPVNTNSSLSTGCSISL